MRFPRVRRLRTLMVAVAVIAVVLVVVENRTSTVTSGPVIVPLAFHAQDARTGKPIPGALIQVWTKGSSTSQTDITDAEGNVQFQYWTTYSSRSSIMGRGGVRVRYDSGLHCFASGYRVLRTLLVDVTKDRRYHVDAVPPPVIVRLEAGPRDGTAEGRLDSPDDK